MSKQKDSCPLDESDEELEMRFAMKEARRHYVGEEEKFDNALAALKKAMDYRIEKRIDIMRQVGDESALEEITDEKDRELLERFKGYIEDEYAKQIFFIGGYDRENRSLAIRGDRTDAKYDPEGYMVCLVYSIERAIATTEILSRGKEEKIHSWLDMGNYDSQHSPGTGVYRNIASTLR